MKRQPTSAEIEAVALASANDDAVLVGGMAVALLANAYGEAGGMSIFTRDVDFFGDRLALEKARVGLQWPAREYLASMDDCGPNSGKLAVDVAADAEPVEVDFLYRLDGLSADEIEQKAVVIAFGDVLRVRVLHPLLLLENKINNLALYPGKRTVAGIGQADMAIRIAKAYLSRLVEEREQLTAMERVARYAGREGACFAHKAFSLDVLHALPDAPLNGNFTAVRLPQLIAHIEERRQAFAKVWERAAATGGHPATQRFRAS